MEAPSRSSSRFELAFLHHALMLLARALDLVSIIAITAGKLPSDLVEAIRRMATRDIRRQNQHPVPYGIYEPSSWASHRHMQHCGPFVTAHTAQPVMMNDSLAAILGRSGCGRRWTIAARTATGAGIIVVHRHERRVARNVDRVGLRHGALPRRGGSTTGLSATGAWTKMPMISSI